MLREVSKLKSTVVMNDAGGGRVHGHDDLQQSCLSGSVLKKIFRVQVSTFRSKFDNFHLSDYADSTLGVRAAIHAAEDCAIGVGVAESDFVHGEYGRIEVIDLGEFENDFSFLLHRFQLGSARESNDKILFGHFSTHSFSSILIFD